MVECFWGESMNQKSYYHGSNKVVQRPNLERSRKDIDFGVGHYLTPNERLAKKWACAKPGASYVNIYDMDFSGLKIKRLQLDEEWLHYVAGNRTGHPERFELYFDDSEYDIITGPIADDNLFTTIDLYIDGLISAQKAVKVMDCMNYGEQIVLKTNAALAQLHFFSVKELSSAEETHYRQEYNMEKFEKKEKTAMAMRMIRD